MRKITTPKLTHQSFDTDDNEVVVPSAKTLDFLKTFARTYFVDKSLPKQFNEVSLN